MYLLTKENLWEAEQRERYFHELITKTIRGRLSSDINIFMRCGYCRKKKIDRLGSILVFLFVICWRPHCYRLMHMGIVSMHRLSERVHILYRFNGLRINMFRNYLVQ